MYRHRRSLFLYRLLVHTELLHLACNNSSPDICLLSISGFFLNIPGSVNQLLIVSVPVNKIKYFMQANSKYKETYNSKYEGQQ